MSKPQMIELTMSKSKYGQINYKINNFWSHQPWLN